MKTQKSVLAGLVLAFLLTLSPQLSTCFAQGTAFTYQGQLKVGGEPANGLYDFYFQVIDAPDGGTVVGGAIATNGLAVSNGLFSITLDFGAGVFTGAARWLEITVSTNLANNYFTLAPRQQLTPTPYAIFAEGANATGLSGAVPSGSLSGTYGSQLTFNNAGNSFTGNGSGLTGVNAATLGGLGAGNFWQTTGNAGTAAGVNFVGTTDYQPLELKVNNSRAMRLEPNTNGAPNVIGGSSANFVSPGRVGVVIAGGGATNYAHQVYSNSVYSDFGVIGGGYSNSIASSCTGSTIAGGLFNTMIGQDSDASIGGGYGNSIGFDDFYSAIGGGYQNLIQTGAYDSSIGGGQQNMILDNAYFSTIGSGYQNQIQTNSSYSIIGGGAQNLIQPNAGASTIVGGTNNTIQANAPGSTIAGGYLNTIYGNNFTTPYLYASTIGGGAANTIQTNASDSTIGGGADNTIWAGAADSTIGGGDNNSIYPGAYDSTIGGGGFNFNHNPYSTTGGGFFNLSGADYSTIGGGQQNLTGGTNSTIGGGYLNATEVGNSTIGGGYRNEILYYSDNSTIGGGYFNIITNNAPAATIGGGGENVIHDGAYESTISGGDDNQIYPGAYVATLSGGTHNRIGGAGATIPGGNSNKANGVNSFAAGTAAQANHDGSFVWADSSSYSGFADGAPNEFLVRAGGGVYFATGNGGANQQVSWVPGNGSWSFTSDRNAKENFKPVDVRQVLDKVAQLPLTEWNYKGYQNHHVGPMAQDFHAAFPFNTDDKMINSADEAGVTLAAIQGLNAKLETEAKQKDLEIEQLKQSLADLKALVSKLAASQKSTEAQ